MYTEQQIKEERAEVFMQIFGVSKMSDVLKLFRKDYNSCKNTSTVRVNKLFGKYSYAIYFLYSPSSIRNNLVKFKKVIEQEGGKFQSIALESFTIDNIYVPIKKKDIERKKELKQAERAEESESYNIENVKIVKEHIEELKDILKNKRYIVRGNQTEEQVRSYYLLALLGLSTGRRFTELLLTLKITKDGIKTYFKGLLKGNIQKLEANIIGLTVKEAQKYLRELRRYVPTKGLTEEQVNAKYARTFNNALKRLGYNNVKSLRHNYTIAGSQIFNRKNETKEDTIARILGHRESFSSALNYT